MRLHFGIGTALAAMLASTSSAQAPGAPATITGQLEDSDRHDGAEGAEIYDSHTFRLEAGRRYAISASSEDFDTYIRLYQTGETEPVAENDDYGGTLNSRITYVPEETAGYVLRVLPFSETGRGAYEVRVEQLPPLPPPLTAETSEGRSTRWQVWEGELGAGDPERDGAYFDDYLVAMRAGDTHIISAEAAGFDPMIWVMRADAREGEPLDVDDDAGPGTNALLGFRAEDGGDYIVRVISLGAGDTGTYRLRISAPLTPPPPAPVDEPSEESGD